MRDFTRPGVIVLFCCALFAQSSDSQHYEVADVHVSAKTNNDRMRMSQIHSGRLEIRSATMLNLLSSAYGYAADKILGGPNWLELDHYDVIAKVPAGSALETQGPVLKALLKERFKLVAHEETRPAPGWVLTAGKQPKMKEADGSGDTGCKAGRGNSENGGPKIFRGNPDGSTTAISIGPGMTIQYSCRNMTMSAFAAGLRTMEFTLLNSPVVDRTNLKGMWNFDLTWSLPLPPIFSTAADAGKPITLPEAIDKQLGLKLEEVPIPTKVLVVDSVERKPTDNPPGVKEGLPDIAAPTEFEVADVKLTDAGGGLPMGFPRMQPGGRFVAQGVPMRLLLSIAFNVNNNDSIVGIPNWVDSVRVSITAKVGGDHADAVPIGNDPEYLGPLLRSLPAERFGLAWHTEQLQGTAYSLVAAKPKLKKADPNSRIFCRNEPPGPGGKPGEQVLNCRNATMALFAQRLQVVPTINAPVDDATGLEGGWDFTFSFNPFSQLMLNGAGRGAGDAGPGGAPVASDPSGGYTVFQSIEKQLGLKLEAKKKMVSVTVIDKLNQKPSDN